MILFKKKTQKKQTPSEEARAKRLQEQLKSTTQNSIAYTSLYESGLMHVVDDTYSMTFKLGDAAYNTATAEQQLKIVETHADAFNGIDSGSTAQLLIINKQVNQDVLKQILYHEENDGFNDYRAEKNQMIEERFNVNANNFEVHKYLTVSQEAVDRKQAQIYLQDVGVSLQNIYKRSDIAFAPLSGMERLEVFSELLLGQGRLPYSYHDLELTGLTTKSFIAPQVLEFFRRSMEIDTTQAKVLYIKHYPKSMEDDLIKELTSLGIELAISIHAESYDSVNILAEIEEAQAEANTDQIKAVKYASQKGIPAEFVSQSRASEDSSTAGKWRREIKEYDQKIFRGMISVFFKADSMEELARHQAKIERAGRKVGVRFSEIDYHQDDALNTILPIGKNYLDLLQNLRIKKLFPRSMTTANVATQIPFTSVDCISKSPTARYYGQNQTSNNMITLDRKRDLNTPSGVIMGSSGSGKSVTAKEEIISTLLKYQKDKIIIVDPEDEYSDIGQEFGAEIIDVAVGTQTQFNILDIPNKDKLQKGDQDPEGDKANLLITLFSGLLASFDDEAISLVDRVTRAAYERFERPTLKDWHGILKEQPEGYAQDLALKLEIYTIGSYDIFSNETNVNMDSRFIIFNLKRLSGNLKQFAMMVIQDFIWNQVVNARDEKITIWLYFDEIQLYFEEEVQATYFNHMWSRIRKYGCIPTGITQMPETLTASPQGRKLLGNSEFKVLLKLEGQALQEIKKVVKLTDQQASYIENPKAKGTGLIVAGSTIVPFENPIKEETKLYRLIATDA